MERKKSTRAMVLKETEVLYKTIKVLNSMSQNINDLKDLEECNVFFKTLTEVKTNHVNRDLFSEIVDALMYKLMYHEEVILKKDKNVWNRVSNWFTRKKIMGSDWQQLKVYIKIIKSNQK